ncbi:MAG: DUF6746 family protein [Alphaproteobacteria bacterium]
MKKLMTVLGVCVLSVAAPVCGFAEEQAAASEEPRTDHYKGAVVETSEQALGLLNEKIDEIGAVLKNEGELEFTELEHIHELSYSLETGIDFIIAEKTAVSAQTDAVDEAVQAIHYASENGEEAKTREWFVKLQEAVSVLKLNDVAAADVAPEKKEFYEIVIKDHKFSPEEIIVPAGQKVKLIIDNQDPTPEEFESHDMNREKVIGGGKKATIFIGPLKPGKYHFFGEFNMDTANGYVIAK